jgi:hypothetical protein
MKKLFYRLSSSRSLAKLFSMGAQLEERKREVFFAVVALAAFLSLGALLFPQVAQADCYWGTDENPCDVGSDPSSNPWGNSPQALDILYCLDADCVLNLTDSIGNKIFPNGLPTASTAVTHSVGSTSLPAYCPGLQDVTISGNVVALLSVAGFPDPGSAAQASLFIKVLCVQGSVTTTLSRVVAKQELRTNVFAANSGITILAPTTTTFIPGTSIPLPSSLSHPRGWTGCPTNNPGILNGNCGFPLGIVEFNSDSQIAKELPATSLYAQGGVYHAEAATGAFGIRDCKGDPDTSLPLDQNSAQTIQCSTGGGEALGLLFLLGNYSGAADHTFNPTKGSNPYDIDISSLPTGTSIDPDSVLASANGGIPIPATSCSPVVGQSVERCFIDARALKVTCTTGQPVDLLVTGQLTGGPFDGRKFSSTDPQLVCSNSKK